jgi:hypothetical protein
VLKFLDLICFSLKLCVFINFQSLSVRNRRRAPFVSQNASINQITEFLSHLLLSNFVFCKNFPLLLQSNTLFFILWLRYSSESDESAAIMFWVEMERIIVPFLSYLLNSLTNMTSLIFTDDKCRSFSKTRGFGILLSSKTL